ncbi:hypothetical protein G5V59_27535 [Nocardioides sp. W3-2-3]|uniref:hypothetical protein n=1 Tax=Nocardioides convexus TaxID=2712224 RepID=UPI00241836C6|nr:hypothetical protein [Nocardioides convexus]NHA02134.1 hypothetical protein [Nocardioides convexus]
MPARGVVATSRCRAYDPNLRNGVCHQFPDGKVTWLGNFTNPTGRAFFCIDKNLDSRLPATAPVRSTAGLRNQFGKGIGDREVSALNYVIDRWGKGATSTEAAAIALIIREVMSDTGGQFPSGLKVGQEVIAPRGGLNASIVRLAGSMWNLASAYRGPWTLQADRQHRRYQGRGDPRHQGGRRLGRRPPSAERRHQDDLQRTRHGAGHRHQQGRRRLVQRHRHPCGHADDRGRDRGAGRGRQSSSTPVTTGSSAAGSRTGPPTPPRCVCRARSVSASPRS